MTTEAREYRNFGRLTVQLDGLVSVQMACTSVRARVVKTFGTRALT